MTCSTYITLAKKDIPSYKTTYGVALIEFSDILCKSPTSRFVVTCAAHHFPSQCIVVCT
ncbi:uncharacterized protein LACBIDRAFT_309132 [Laccaria bicolor S238N-H82]|uniref:Predicted protein n=1 Tax=Laccaria bicolor (strain S238N-H82 / ATCC MYA-4686) TaxID=486041 RepID=B0CVM3_LACBS|nr:uncharacterized protein LACBIDRAFT_309132 [Laccaria bicolor S238N-H82]EDR13358.1 predicted protein [Laccaria bicolor S238N-H82]|eukprot:XP_001875856.1 predicted protein [Laccaria bicolor S238N-H82]